MQDTGGTLVSSKCRGLERTVFQAGGQCDRSRVSQGKRSQAQLMHREDLGFHKDGEVPRKASILRMVVRAAVWRTDCRGQKGSRKVRQEGFLSSRCERKVARTKGSR